MLDRPIRAIVVDDEQNARRLLPVLIDWATCGWEFVGEAGNGQEALDLVETLKPDVVFADINMPYMSGLEFTRHVRKNDPFIKVVIITAYPEFEYAQESVHLGVSDFLLKPLQIEAVQKLAEGLRERIDDETTHWREFRDMREQLDATRRSFRDLFLAELILGSAPNQELAARWSYFLPEKKWETGSVAVVELRADPGLGVEDLMLVELQATRFLETLLQDTESVLMFRDFEGETVLLSLSDSDLSEITDHLTSLLKDRLGLTAYVGIGKSVEEMADVRQSYREARDALKYQKLTGSQHAVSYGGDLLMASPFWELPAERISDIVFLTKAGIEARAEEALGRLFSELSASSTLVVEQIHGVAVQVAVSSINALADVGISLDSDTWKTASVLHRILASASVVEIQQLLVDLIKAACHQIRDSRMTKTKSLVAAVKEFLLRVFNNPDVSLTSVAEEFHCNSSYLSRVFKQESGMSFTEFLVRQRVEEGARLLVETELKAYQIAEQVGIRDPYYFSNCFKKVLGVSVQEYRRSLSSGS